MQKRLPIGITSFNEMQDDNYIYVDKTDIIAKFVSTKGPHFLSRPRRFGKSTLVDTFEVLFSQGLEAFNGLKITQSDTCESLDEIKQKLYLTKQYKVLRLSFDDIDNLSPKEIEIKYIKNLKKFFTTLDIYIDSDSTDISTIMDIGCEQLQEQIVLLIDEYDTPLTYYLDDSEKFKEIRAILSRFYKIVKRYDEIFRFIFITGITKYSNDNIFSGFNNYQDLSFNSKYGSIVGYTQEELEYYFKDYIQKAAVTLNEKEKTDIYTYDVILQKLKEHYDGYCFDRFASIHVYNPWSILNFLDEPQEGFIPYWLNSGGAFSSLILKYLQIHIKDHNVKEKITKFFDLNHVIDITQDELEPAPVSIESSNFDLYPILYQAGYLTIKDAFLSQNFELVIPNAEVAQAYAKLIYNLVLKDKDREHEATSIVKALYKHNYEPFKIQFNQFLHAFISYASIINFKESMFVDMCQLFLYTLGIIAHKEFITSSGRIDLVFEIENTLYVCEFKLAVDDKQVDTMFNEACTQIKNKEYYAIAFNKDVIALAIVVLNTKLNKANKKAKSRAQMMRIEEVEIG